MKKQITVSGFGGQGVLSIGKSLVEAGMDEGLEVTWAPSYGPEMRGGTANCSVVISDKPIGSPVFTHPTELIAMNLPALEKFEPRVVEGGLIIVNSSVVDQKVKRTDVKAFYVPCIDIATELGNTKVANMVMLGAYVKATGALKVETVQEMIKNMFTGRKAKLVPMNMEALQRGMECIK
ncbi:MAG: 2-oxoacid:acceptor oxidoreductase family protein [Eubacterium sp.]|jgi:2-oxoglutarate ferredoxin oxidoreductase subunit gamma|nr:2-oxoacid:acceptor oxidoreductase family protein [Eubacterium sp.]MCH4047518.1 2-oxoacid:acceptor oxidoreductase family protein [Eubacterium sp.]MCH4078288.1 2-oxoacid:acceptor oxidoreductase family protein [Eubacterium sp.]MCH4109435.1 2-oxoacid:acceptor oxidoreductase family protein [Eubacterium sp.]MCI1307589.1 2-oxoacid:acceptor oxidoreductase family protein [Eubacterium sp.]